MRRTGQFQEDIYIHVHQTPLSLDTDSILGVLKQNKNYSIPLNAMNSALMGRVRDRITTSAAWDPGRQICSHDRII